MGSEVYKARRLAPTAFTLLELLVVVAMICLLFSIMLPSMSSAREQASRTACAANLSSLARAGASYQTEYRGFVPGSPLTTGFPLVVKDLGNAGLWQRGMALNIFDYSVPLMKQMGIVLPRGADPRPYFRLSTEGVFQCPENRQVAVSWPVDNGVTIRAPSYLTMNTLMRGGPDTFEFWQRPENKKRLNISVLIGPGGAKYYEAAEYKDIGQSDRWAVQVPRGYVPHIDSVGRPGMKVFLADGLRFFHPPATIDYNLHTTGFAGNFSAQPPCDVFGSTVAAREYNLARVYSYRHLKGRGINMGMFDGHVERQTADFTAFHRTGYATEGRGAALQPRQYFPSRSVIQDNSNFFLRAQVAKGAILP